MSIHEEIRKATSFPQTVNNDYKFERLKGPGRAEKDRLMNQRRVRVPRNISLLADDNMEDTEDLDSECEVNHFEIASFVKKINGGSCYSNEGMEVEWKKRQRENSYSSDSPSDNAQSMDNSESNNDNILIQSGLSRNAAIVGLLNAHEISYSDLYVPGSSQQRTDVAPNKKINLVEHPEDPDVLVQPFLAYGTLDKEACKDIDFTVDHVGQKTTIPPTQYYTNGIDESQFEFRKKTKP